MSASARSKAVAASAGAPAREANGTVTNLAARLCAEAKPERILISPGSRLTRFIRVL